MKIIKISHSIKRFSIFFKIQTVLRNEIDVNPLNFMIFIQWDIECRI